MSQEIRDKMKNEIKNTFNSISEFLNQNGYIEIPKDAKRAVTTMTDIMQTYISIDTLEENITTSDPIRDQMKTDLEKIFNSMAKHIESHGLLSVSKEEQMSFLVLTDVIRTYTAIDNFDNPEMTSDNRISMIKKNASSVNWKT